MLTATTFPHDVLCHYSLCRAPEEARRGLRVTWDLEDLFPAPTASSTDLVDGGVVDLTSVAPVEPEVVAPAEAAVIERDILVSETADDVADSVQAVGGEDEEKGEGTEFNTHPDNETISSEHLEFKSEELEFVAVETEPGSETPVTMDEQTNDELPLKVETVANEPPVTVEPGVDVIVSNTVEAGNDNGIPIAVDADDTLITVDNEEPAVLESQVADDELVDAVDQVVAVSDSATASAPNASASNLTEPATESAVKPLSADERVASQYILMARAYMSRGLYELAIKQLAKAFKRAPAFPDVFMVRAEAYLALGDFNSAGNDVVRVLELSPCNGTALQYAKDLGLEYVRGAAASGPGAGGGNAVDAVRSYYLKAIPLLSAVHNCSVNETATADQNEGTSERDGVAGRSGGGSSDVERLEVAFSLVSALTYGQEYKRALEVLQALPVEAVTRTRKGVLLLAGLLERTNAMEKAEPIWLGALEAHTISQVEIGNLTIEKYIVLESVNHPCPRTT